MRDDYNYQTTDKKLVAGRWLTHDVYTHETLFGGTWYAEEDWPALVEAVERDNEQRDRADEARMEYNEQRSSADESD